MIDLILNMSNINLYQNDNDDFIEIQQFKDVTWARFCSTIFLILWGTWVLDVLRQTGPKISTQIY